MTAYDASPWPGKPARFDATGLRYAYSGSVAATGRASSPDRLCDSAARFETGGTGRHNPTWVQRTGGDSLYAVAVTGSAVYLGGHQRYFDNPYGTDTKGPGPGEEEYLNTDEQEWSDETGDACAHNLVAVAKALAANPIPKPPNA